MKLQKEKLLDIIIVIVILAGMIMLMVKGLNFDLRFQEAKTIPINIGKTFEIKEMKEIAKEVFGEQKVLIQKVEVYEEGVSFTVKEVTEEQKEKLATKLNEKYGLEIKVEDITINDVSHTRGRDIIKPYIAPISIATVIIIAYMAIRYHKLNALRVVTRTLGTVILFQLILLSMIALVRIPVGNLTIPMVLTVYMLSLLLCPFVFEKELKEKIVSDKK